jgi:hypothetical protein
MKSKRNMLAYMLVAQSLMPSSQSYGQTLSPSECRTEDGCVCIGAEDLDVLNQELVESEKCAAKAEETAKALAEWQDKAQMPERKWYDYVEVMIGTILSAFMIGFLIGTKSH